jgi:hypothetical protein
MHKVLSGNPADDRMLKVALSAIGYTKATPILHAGHPVWDTATENGRIKSAIFVAMNTKGDQSCISDMTVPLHKDFHRALCEYGLDLKLLN